MFKPKAVDSSLIDKKNELYKKKIFINRDIMLDDIDITRAMLNKLVALGAKNVNFVNNCDYYVGEVSSEEHCKGTVISLEKFLAMLGELEIVSYDDKTILQEYNKEKENRRKLDAIAKLNDKNKALKK